MKRPWISPAALFFFTHMSSRYANSGVHNQGDMMATYFATVTFAASALTIASIAAAVEKADTRGSILIDHDAGNNLICLMDDDAPEGRIELTDVLDRHKIAYDHLHKDDSSMEEHTDHVRFDSTGRRLVYGTNPETDAQAALANEVLKLMMENRFDEARTMLEATITMPFEPLDQTAASQAADATSV
jgi:hypothetical protein